MNIMQKLLCGATVWAVQVTFGQDCTDMSDTLHRPYRGEISRNFYRIPYATGGGNVNCFSSDYWGHGGSFDMFGLGPDPTLVAPADGVICYVREDRNDCGCHADFGGCWNLVIVAHANGEYSRHLHIEQWSVSDAGLEVGDPVTAGQIIAREGDVGRTCGANPARVGTCLTSVPPGT